MKKRLMITLWSFGIFYGLLLFFGVSYGMVPLHRFSLKAAFVIGTHAYIHIAICEKNWAARLFSSTRKSPSHPSMSGHYALSGNNYRFAIGDGQQ